MRTPSYKINGSLLKPRREKKPKTYLDYLKKSDYSERTINYYIAHYDSVMREINNKDYVEV
jgi:hypothetical protein